MKITPTPVTAAMAGAFAGVVMPLLWPRLGDDTLDWILAFLLVLAVSVLKAFRLPIEYPATLMLFDYSAGFIRRGLFGTLVFPGGLHAIDDTPIVADLVREQNGELGQENL